MEREDTFTYTGGGNLEIVEEAVNYNQGLRRLFQKYATPKKEHRILDFGAGIGTFAEVFREEGLLVDCFEIDAGQQQVLKEKGFTVFDSFDAIRDGSYDRIYSFNVLEHIKDDGETVRCLSEKLSADGKLFVFVPAFMLLYSDMDRVVEHERRYGRARLRTILTEAGLEIERIRFFDSVGFFAALLFKLIGAKNSSMTKGKVIFYDRVAFPLSMVSDLFCQFFFGKNLYAVCRKPNMKK